VPSLLSGRCIAVYPWLQEVYSLHLNYEQGRIQRGGRWGWSPPNLMQSIGAPPEPFLQFLAMNEEEEEKKVKKEEGKARKKEEDGKLSPLFTSILDPPLIASQSVPTRLCRQPNLPQSVL